MTNQIVGIFAFVEVILILLFPSIGPGNGTAFCTYGMYLLIPVAIYIQQRSAIFNQYDIVGIKYMRVLVRFLLMLIIGALFSLLFSNVCNNDVHAIFANIMFVLYAYVFYVFACVSEIRKFLNFAILLSALILAIYSIYSYITASNIYTDYFDLYFRDNYSTQDSSTNDFYETRGLSYRVYGNVNNPVFFSGQLMLLQGYCTYLYLKDNIDDKRRKAIISLIVLLVIGNIFTGSKSGILPSIAFLYYMLFKRYGIGKSIFISMGSILIIAVAVMPLLDGLFNINLARFIYALNPFNENTGGSTTSGRMTEYLYLSEFVGSDFLFGRGIGWCRAYTIIKGIHPVLHTFESLIMSSFVEGGLWGLLFVYPIYMYGLYKLHRNHIVGLGYRLFIFGYYFFILVSGIGMTKFFYIGLGLIINDKRSDKKNE